VGEEDRIHVEAVSPRRLANPQGTAQEVGERSFHGAPV
jgi:hypothetical protein